MSDLICPHNIHLRGSKSILRPFTDADIPTAWHWNQDPEVLYYSEGDDVVSYTLEDVRDIYQSMSQQGYLFIIETLDGKPIGEVCLQWMNLERANVMPGEKVMRSPIMIGERAYWGKGYGRDVIGMLMRYAFQVLRIDRFCAMGIAAFNERCLRTFSSLWLREVRRLENSTVRGTVRSDEIDLEITREEYLRISETQTEIDKATDDVSGTPL